MSHQKSKKMPGRISGKAFIYIMLFVVSIPHICARREDSEILSPERLQFYFTQEEYNATIFEETFGNTQIRPSTKMGIFLTDTSVIVRYKLRNKEHNDLFETESRIVGNFCFLQVRTKTSDNFINRERTSHYRLQIEAVGNHRRAGQRFTDTTTINVEVLDINEHSPIFEEDLYSTFVPEDAPMHTSIAQVGATDADEGVNGDIYYSFQDVIDTFAIHPTTGVVTVTGKLDASVQDSYELVIVARDRGIQANNGNGRSRTSLITIGVQKVNAHAPVIRIHKIENTMSRIVGSVLAILDVVDKDSGLNGELDPLEIVSGDNSRNFKLVAGERYGEYRIQVVKNINPNARGFNLTVRASDKGTPKRSTYSSVLLDFMQQSDVDPHFSKDIYKAFVDECAPVHTQILLVTATDGNEDKSGSFKYQIVGGNDGDWFHINANNGMISVNKPLDAEQSRSIELTVLAEDQVRSPTKKYGQTSVNIHVNDCNDNGPIFGNLTQVVNVHENSPSGKSIGRVSANDPDNGDSGFISYSIANIEQVPFEVDHFTGEITMAEPLDFETHQREYHLQIRASDWGSPFRRESEVVIRVLLADVNDNTPGFEKVDCIGHLSKEAPVGTNVVTISAIDFDAGDIISYEIVSGNEDDCFDMMSASGMIKTKCDLRRATPNFRSLVVRATDGVHFSEPTTVNITLVNNKRSRSLSNRDANVVCTNTEIAKALKDLLKESARNNDGTRPIVPGSASQLNENKHWPTFPIDMDDRKTIPENLDIGSTVYTFNAHDDDYGYNGLLRYVIADGNYDCKFNISTYTGELYVISPIDREKKDLYTLNITVYDSASNVKGAFRTFNVDISDINDNAPRFEKASYSTDISEDQVVGKSVIRVEADDLDLDSNAEVTFSLVTANDFFRIDPRSGVILIAKSLDREYQSVHELSVQAKDSGEVPLASVVTVTVNIGDVNDNPPAFMPSSYHVHIREDLPIGAVVLTLTAHDPDLNTGGIVRYALLEGMDNSFDIDPVTGIVRITKPLDYENKQLYNMTARAKDRGNPPLPSRCTIIIEIVDVDENLYTPKFSDYVYEVEIEENKPRGTEILQLVATDLDDKHNRLASARDYELTYSIVGGDGIGKFSVDDEGMIRTNAVLDRESKWQYWLTVVTSDRGAVPRSAWAEVYIRVLDVNDNIPRTSLPVYYPTAPENSEEIVKVQELKVTDLDADGNNKPTFEITSGNPQGFFAIDSTTGIITTTSRKLDREKQDEHVLEVTIRDNGRPVLSSTTRVVVKVTDVNDNDPKFMDNYYRVAIPEMPSPGFEVPLFRVIASDLDEGDNADISYSITDGKGDGRFRIYPKTGMIQSEKEFTRGRTFELIIEAMDNGRERRRATTRVLFQVVPRPETSAHAPRFSTPGATEEVMENLEVGSVIRTPQATDQDHDTIWYSIVAGNEDDVFSIDGTMGSVLLATPLDREMKASYNLTIRASDAVHDATAWLHIVVRDVNDNRPQFDQDSYTVSVSESIAAGTSLLTLTATDADEDKRLFYTLHAVADEASRHKFQIDSETDKDGRWTGVLTTTSTLNRESVAKHELTIMVRDQGAVSKRSLASVTIIVEDYNDHSPEFLQDGISGAVHETAAMGTTVVKVMAIDRDHGRNAQIAYSIISGNIGNTFSIDNRLGLIAVEKQLDRLKHATYTLTVRATDGGIPPLSNTSSVQINVTVADNAPPKFIVNEYTAEIPENKPELTVIAFVSAISQSSLVYEITRGDEDQSFIMNPSSGIIMSNTEFDFEKRAFYNLTVRASNVMNVYVEASVLVHVVDENDNAPAFDDVMYTGTIGENAAPGSVILNASSAPLVIKATDMDSDMNALLTYSIIDPLAKELFHIDPSTGAIKTRVSLDYEEADMYSFQVQVEDSGIPSKSSEVAADVIIYVTDVNDSPPVFDKLEFQATVLLPTYEGVVVVEAKATDADSPINGELTYSITSGNEEQSFKIDEKTGVISMNTEGSDLLDRYDLGVKVTDGTFEFTCRVKIAVDMTHDSGLVFTQEEYNAYVYENSTAIEKLTVVQARGYSLNEHLTFSILNPSDMFQIGETSGVIQSTGIPFDREKKDSYTLVVEVKDGRQPPRLAHALVRVAVRDINDNVPLFVNQPYYTIVSLDATKGNMVRKVEAIDKDLDENGRVRYSIVSGNVGRKFQMEPETGEIYVKREFAPEDENRQYVLIVQAMDNGYHEQLYSRVEVPITVKNRHTPIFADQFYSIEIPEDIEVGSAILDIIAESPTGKKVIYSISGGNIYGEFDIEFSMGSLTVIDHLDYENQRTYELTVRATDTMTGSYAEIKVQVNLKDVNDYAPRFEGPQYLGSVSEAAPVGTSVMTVSAYDQDSGINARLHYSILPIDAVSRDNQYFHIEPDTGVVLTKQKLDHEEHDMLTFIVMATDGGYPSMSSSVVVKVNVTDMNDNPPIFDRPVYEVFVTDLATRGQFVTIVSASDADSTIGGMRFSIVGGNERQVFHINEFSGEILLSDLRNPVFSSKTYMLNVSVTDGVFTSFATVKINVRNSNSHVPRFEHTVYDVDISENLPRKTKVATLSATDEDQGIFGDVTYSIDSRDMEDVFEIDRKTGELRTASMLDREECSQYFVPIAAVDGGGRAGYTTVRVNVADQGDNKPHFLLSNYRANVYSTAAENTEVIQVSAVDRDLGMNADLDYSLYGGNSNSASDWFEIERKTGKIKVKRGLVEKENTMIEFFVRATDKEGPPRKNEVPVEIFVMSPDETAPEFAQDSFDYFMAEDREVGSIIATVSAKHNDTLIYSIVSGFMPHTNNPPKFGIDADGKIKVVEPIDREELEKFELTIMAATETTPPLVAYCRVTVQIIDVNDNPPRFESNPYNVMIAENAEIGSSVVQVIAHDIDTGSNADITYTFATEDAQISSVFLLDPESGWITTLIDLDRETISEYSFNVVARDRGSQVRQSDVTRMRVTVMDHNDEPPVFSVDVYEGQVSEDALLGTVVLSIRTTDGDEGVNAEVAYSIIAGDLRGQFAVRNTGEIYVNKALDRETISNYNLKVAATDGAFVATADVKVKVLDVNDNAPICERPQYSKSMPEGQPIGSYILQVSAADADEPETPHSEVTYELEDNFGVFDIRRNGIISNVRLIDREVTPKYKLHVKAMDGDGLQCSIEVVVTLEDKNDNAPVFQGIPFPAIRLQEDAMVNTTLTRVTAIDADVGINRRLKYGLSRESEEHFKIDETSGILSLRRKVDRERQDLHNVTIYAADLGTPRMSAVTYVIIHVLDVNDNPPEFEHSMYNQVVSEAMEVRSTVIRVFATSRDIGVNAEIEYRIAKGNGAGHFYIEPETGIVSLVKALDYEIAREYILTIEARDKGHPPLTNSAILRVNVTDYNDNAPHFTQKEYRATVFEDWSPSTEVVTVLATDIDSEPNAMVTYFIVGGDPEGHFAINQQSGALTINKALDREQVDSYTLDIHAIDQGSPSLTGTSEIYLTILDVNDSPPKFDSDNYTANVQEDRDIGHRVLEVTVTDDDLDPNGAPFSYDIISGNDDNEFRITRDGVIHTTARFDRDIKDTYQLTVRVFDFGDPPLYSDTLVTIKIIEESAYPPYVTPISVTVTTDGDTFCNGVIGHVKAIDRDPYDILQYGLDERSMRYFDVHSQDGSISVKTCIDPGEYLLNVSVTDGKYVAFGDVNLRVMAIYEELAEEAFVIRFENMQPSDFVGYYRDQFLDFMSDIYNVDSSQVHILSIQPSSDSIREPHPRSKRQSGSNTDVLVAIGDRDDVVRRKKALKILNSAKDDLEEELQVSLVGIIHDVCPQGACANSGDCVTVVYFLDDEVTPILTDEESYVSAKHQLGYVCQCNAGYGGLRCEESIDLCDPNPCPSPRLCVSDGLDYICECPPGTSGQNCQYAGDCGSEQCQDEQPVAFSGKSYLVWKVTVAMERNLYLALDVKTVQRHARLMHAVGALDYSVLEIENGHVQYRFDCGSGEGLAKSNTRINDGLWHSILVERNGRNVKLTIDADDRTEGSAPGSSDVLNLDRNQVYFGGEVATSDAIHNGFVGCMKGISIGHEVLPLSGSNSVGVLQAQHNVEFHCRGIYLSGTCMGSSCENGGTCQAVGQNQHLCQCRWRFSGARCEIDSDPCVSNPCLNGGKCTKHGQDYHCECASDNNGKRCELTEFCNSNPCLHGGECFETTSGPKCTCYGFEGKFCDKDIDECASQPCKNGATCLNTIGSFKCNCTDEASGVYCEKLLVPHIQRGAIFGFGWEEILAFIIAILLIFLLVIIFAVIFRWRRRSKRPYTQAPTDDGLHDNGKKLFYSDEDLKARNKIGSVEDNRLNIPLTPSPSPQRREPPPVPARPASYTPSAEGTLNSLGGMEGSRNYGSQADDLNNMSTITEPIQIPEFMTNVKDPLLERSPPPPPRKAASQKRSWDPNIDFPDVRKKQHKIMPNVGQSSESIQLLPRGNNGDSMASLPITEVDDDLMQDYHWDTSDWHPTNHDPRRDLSMLPSNSVHTTPAKGGGRVSRSNSKRYSTVGPDGLRPDSITIDPDADYSYTDFADEDEFIDSEYVGDSEFTENEMGSETGDDLDDFDFDQPDYADILQNGLHNYLPHHSDIEPSQTGDSNWGSRDNELNANFDSVGNLADNEVDNDVMHYGFSLPRPRVKNPRKPKANNRFSGDFGREYERATGAIPLDDLSVAGYTSMSSIGNVCEIEDSEANLSDSDSENRSNESMRLVKSNTNLHTVV